MKCGGQTDERTKRKIMSSTLYYTEEFKVPSVLSHNNLTCATLLCCLDGMVCSLN